MFTRTFVLTGLSLWVALASPRAFAESLIVAQSFIETQLQRAADGSPLIKYESFGGGMVHTFVYSVKVTAISPELASRYFALGQGVVVTPTPIPAGCIALPYGQVMYEAGATHLKVYVGLEGRTCASVVPRFLAEPIEVLYDDVATGMGERLGKVRVRVAPPAPLPSTP